LCWVWLGELYQVFNSVDWLHVFQFFEIVWQLTCLHVVDEASIFRTKTLLLSSFHAPLEIFYNCEFFDFWIKQTLKFVLGQLWSYNVRVAFNVVFENWLTVFEVYIQLHHAFLFTICCCIVFTVCVINQRLYLMWKMLRILCWLTHDSGCNCR